MNTTRTVDRTVVGVVLMTLLVPLLGLAAVMSDAGASVRDARLARKDLIQQKQKEVENLGVRKRHLRLRIVRLNKDIAATQKRFSGALLDLDSAQVDLDVESERLVSFIRYMHTRQETADIGPRRGRTLFDTLLGRSMGDRVDEDLRSAALRRARAELLASLQSSEAWQKSLLVRLDASVRAMTEDLAKTKQKYAALLKEYDTAFRALQIMRQDTDVSDEAKKEERAVVADIRAAVAESQAKLERMQMRNERTAERDLVRMGLLGPRIGAHVDAELPKGKTRFGWPVAGPISAGFNDTAYRKKFGFPHHAVDIVTHQGTPVGAAADGIVFVTRDGGSKGFSYVLIGHAGGYTTLYGHLLTIGVRVGQQVDRGQIIGFSGGEPGTHGAGPSTTGPHLHFEVTQNGVYVNPLTVLP